MQHAVHHHASAHSEAFAHPRRNVGAFGIQEGMKVADFGSGSGAYALALAKAVGERGHVYAVDVQRDLLKRTQNEAQKHRYRQVSVIWGDLEQLGGSKIANRVLDVVLISNLLFQVENKAGVFAEANRVLKPSGRLVIVDWSDSYRGMGPHKKEVFTKDAALRLARECDFELVEEFPAGAHHYGLILRPLKV